jgi:hypothetical protein
LLWVSSRVLLLKWIAFIPYLCILYQSQFKYFAKVGENHFILPQFANLKKKKLICYNRLTQI